MGLGIKAEYIKVVSSEVTQERRHLAALYALTVSLLIQVPLTYLPGMDVTQAHDVTTLRLTSLVASGNATRLYEQSLAFDGLPPFGGSITSAVVSPWYLPTAMPTFEGVGSQSTTGSASNATQQRDLALILSFVFFAFFIGVAIAMYFFLRGGHLIKDEIFPDENFCNAEKDELALQNAFSDVMNAADDRLEKQPTTDSVDIEEQAAEWFNMDYDTQTGNDENDHTQTELGDDTIFPSDSQDTSEGSEASEVSCISENTLLGVNQMAEHTGELSAPTSAIYVPPMQQSMIFNNAQARATDVSFMSNPMARKLHKQARAAPAEKKKTKALEHTVSYNSSSTDASDMNYMSNPLAGLHKKEVSKELEVGYDSLFATEDQNISALLVNPPVTAGTITAGTVTAVTPACPPPDPSSPSVQEAKELYENASCADVSVPPPRERSQSSLSTSPSSLSIRDQALFSRSTSVKEAKIKYEDLIMNMSSSKAGSPPSKTSVTSSSPRI